VDYSDLSFNHSQVLSDTVSLPRVKWEKGESACFFKVNGVPAVRIEYLRVFIKLCLEMVGKYIYIHTCSGLDRY